MYVFKPRRKVDGRSVPSPHYSGRYRLSGDLAWRTVPLHCTDKEVARQKLATLVRRSEREAAGLEAPVAVADGANRDLADHLADFLGDVTAKGRSPDYVYNLRARNLRLFRECGWRTLREVTAESFIKWRLNNRAKAPKTLNEFLDAARAFLNWLHRVGRAPGNPLLAVEKVQTRGREKRARRAFQLDELQRLLAVAGPRRAAYLVAAYTGLRRNELAQLVVADVRLSELVPFLMVRASTTKNHKSARIELHPDVVEALRELIPSNAPGNRAVFRQLPTVEELKADEARAGIPFLDELWLDKAQTTGFRGVREPVWSFHIGVYRVCRKWLKDRKGRTLTKDDVSHYQKTVVALSETIRLMSDVDDMISKHGGWPAAFQPRQE